MGAGTARSRTSSDALPPILSHTKENTMAERISKTLDLKRLEAKIDQILAAINGDIEKPERPGILERLRLVEAWQKGERWAFAILVTLFLADLGYAFLNVWKGK